MLFLISNLGYTLTLDWIRRYDFVPRTPPTGFKCLIPVDNSQYVVAGTRLFGDENEQNVDWWLGMLNSDVDSLLWQRSYGTTEFWEEAKVILNPGGEGFALLGKRYSDNRSQRNSILKLDENGDSLWFAEYGNPHRSFQFMDGIETSDNGVLLLSDRQDGEFNRHSYITLIKTDTDGELEWQSHIGDDDNNINPKSLIEIDDGSYLVCGRYLTDYPGEEWWINIGFFSKIDHNGELIWFKTYTDSVYENWEYQYAHFSQFRSAVKLDDGGVILVGEINFETDMNPDKRLWMVKIDEDGEVIWSRHFRGFYTGTTFLRKVFEVSNHRIIAFGYIEVMNHQEDTGPYVLLTDAEGNFVDDLEFEEMNWQDYINDVKKIDDNSYIGLVGNNRLIRISVNDNSIISLNKPNINPLIHFTAYPNPFNPFTHLCFSITNQAPVEIEIIDSFGRLIERHNFGITHPGKYRFKWDSNLLPSGVYHSRLKVGNKVKSINMSIIK
ncbi:MAG: T9SS type A sorting domain-containing protein [Candidatus Hatepunaea meridiana]|nr:T9SS type A sorting domain-containing protein [Candidatus Hatepunaea meridiana]